MDATDHMHNFITGIQQIGIGVTDADEAARYYKRLFGMDVLVFDDRAEASLMTRYTGGQVYSRRAVLTMNMAGGGGFEIWQYTSRTPSPQAAPPRLGDLGHLAARIKSSDVGAAHARMKDLADARISSLQNTPSGLPHFWVKDRWENHFDVVGSTDFFRRTGTPTGGVLGSVIGVGDMEKALPFYREVLGLSDLRYDETGVFSDVPESEAGGRFRRVLLSKSPNAKGAFTNLLGGAEVELVQCLDRRPEKIYGQRFWGDPGFIHLCFDVLDMDALKSLSESRGYPFTIDSGGTFEMDKAGGRYCYVEDPDGTLIELVETHKVPILKKLGWYMDLRRRSAAPLPDWMVRMLGLSKVK